MTVAPDPLANEHPAPAQNNVPGDTIPLQPKENEDKPKAPTRSKKTTAKSVPAKRMQKNTKANNMASPVEPASPTCRPTETSGNTEDPTTTNPLVAIQTEPPAIQETKAAQNKHLQQEKQVAAEDLFKLMVERDQATQRANAQPQSVDDIEEDVPLTTNNAALADSNLHNPFNSHSGESFDFASIKDTSSSEEEDVDTAANKPDRVESPSVTQDELIRNLQAKIAELEQACGPVKGRTPAKKTSTRESTQVAAQLRPALKLPGPTLKTAPKKSVRVNPTSHSPACDLTNEEVVEIRPAMPPLPLPVRSNKANTDSDPQAAVVQCPVPQGRATGPTSRKPAANTPGCKIPVQKPAQLTCVKQIKAKATIQSTGSATVEKAPLTGLTSNSVRLKDLPDFVKQFSQWNHAFNIVSEVYPSSGYVVKSSEDPIQLMAIKHLTACWNAIGDKAIENIQDIVTSFSTIQEAHNWLLWAKRQTGPLFFEYPTPAHCVVPPGAPGFILVRTMMLVLKGSVRSFDTIPVGLYALAMAALERAVRCVNASGVADKKTSPFSQATWGAAVNGYMVGLDGVTMEQWDEITASCNEVLSILCGEEENANGEDEDDIRVNIFNFPSPSNVKRL
ncbi:hypothetical protein FA15DRAFT_662093 [Coprinopsis marcescibilis]|uniref:Uncharacterized protein n=1 Tax=Coprinopsis marcescibilis TaxID=230819 RepID=A0A5C3K8Z3_COPMA|nr:hypothetical protein FA15DRAFT_662093 [Coprinopsis marcescibilis]